ncbi:FAS1 domain-containing protein [Cyphellophora attinorum]|uniref:FAS1 domain-containing protein n=1 Tax=Cyphellophora attinorum TaxID=1664694 RepID=A0A0N1HX22_9EURO|nr:FAS1 domain-containing protein [Phialophora attinorum]KPI44956.1 FAS1 domain-containing protein [Phialophora attinorum]
MRRTLLFPILAASAGAFLIPSSFHSSILSRYLPTSNAAPLLRDQSHQSPIMPVLPPGTPSTSDDSAADLTISDILPLSRSINIFAQLTRDIASVTTRLSTNTPASNTTLLAPLNSAMQDLPRKPWEDRPGESNSGVSTQHNEEKAAENLRRFVEMHVVPVSPWEEGEDGKVETLGGDEVWWEWRKSEDGDKKTRVIRGKGFELEVSEVMGRVGNGEVWAVKGVVNYK